MGVNTSIAWTDSTVNFAFGCTKVDLACKNCYMFRILRTPRSFIQRGPRNYIDLKKISLQYFDVDKKVSEVAKWPKSKVRIFVNDMTDTFHEDNTDDRIKEWHQKMFNPMQTRQFQLLTKRIGRAMLFYRKYPELLTPNIWLGCSIGEKSRLFRIKQLLQIPARIKFISFEPLIQDLGEFDMKGVTWCIVGGESGRKEKDIRAMKPEWVLNLRNIAIRDGVKWFYKQKGGVGGDGVGGSICPCCNQVHQEFPEYPKSDNIKAPKDIQMLLA